MADLEKNKQPSRFGTGIETDTIRYSAAHTTFIYKIGMANLWFFGWLVELIMAADPTTDAAQRTTTSPTILSAGVKTNIVPMEVKFCPFTTNALLKSTFPQNKVSQPKPQLVGMEEHQRLT